MSRTNFAAAVLLAAATCALAQVKVITKEREPITGPRVFTALQDISPPYEIKVVVDQHGLINFINIYVNGVHVDANPERTALILGNLRTNKNDQYRVAAEDLHERLKHEGKSFDEIIQGLKEYYESLAAVTEVLVENQRVSVTFQDSTTHSHIVNEWWGSYAEGARARQAELEYFLNRDYSMLFVNEGPIVWVHPRDYQEFLKELQIARMGAEPETGTWRFLLPVTVEAIRKAKERKQ